jgi:hypothetical protein
MAANVPSPDFRYVGLDPAPASTGFGWRGAAVGSLAFGAGAGAVYGLGPLTLLGSLGLGAGLSWLVMRRAAGARAPRSGDIHYIAIVPWGVLLHSDVEPRVLRWQAVTSLDVEYVETMAHGVPSIRWSLVTLCTERESFVGRASGYVALERLEAHLAHYAEESSRPVALDLGGAESVVSGFEPVFERLLGSARHLVRSPKTAAAVGLSCDGYRGATMPRLSERGVGQLLEWVQRPGEGVADRRPLLAVLLGELHVRAASSALLRLVTSPHPFLAATARAALLRLGMDVQRVGALDELSEFVPTAELGQIQAWAVSNAS